MRDPEYHSSRSPTPHSRRRFLRNTVVAVALARLPTPAGQGTGVTAPRRFRAAIIGHTGRGDYGHNLDLVFTHRKDAEVVAVADPDAQGRAGAAARSGALRQYDDYRTMLKAEQPDLVSIAPRWTDQHHAMAMAALRAGAHVFMEKPFTTTLVEADELLALAENNGRRIAVAHQMRLAPEILSLKDRIASGLIGELLEIHAHGKQDRRAGGEDLIVLGIHLFDLMRFFAGEPESCTARVLERGQPITRHSGRPATENIGPVAGDEVSAQFAFSGGINATFTSRARLRELSGPWGITLLGSQGAVRILADAQPRIYLHRRNDWTAAGGTVEWQRWDVPAQDQSETPPRPHNPRLPNQRLVDDWLEAVATGREPVCNGRAAMLALQMAFAVLEAGVRQARVSFPMTRRQHPLAQAG